MDGCNQKRDEKHNASIQSSQAQCVKTSWTHLDTLSYDFRYQNGLHLQSQIRRRGTRTDPPSSITYASVVSRDSV